MPAPIDLESSLMSRVFSAGGVGGGSPRQRLLLLVHTCRQYQESRCLSGLQTWASDPPCSIEIRFLTDQEGSSLPGMLCFGAHAEGPTYHPDTVVKILDYWLTRLDQFDWFMMVDDDTYVYLDRLLSFLDLLDPSQAYWIGDFIGWPRFFPQWRKLAEAVLGKEIDRFSADELWPSGGPGLVFSASAIRCFRAWIADLEIRQSPLLQPQAHDIWLHRIERNVVGSPLTRLHCPGFYQFGDELLMAVARHRPARLISVHLNHKSHLMSAFHVARKELGPHGQSEVCSDPVVEVDALSRDALMLIELGDGICALELFRHAVRLSPDRPELSHNLAELSFRMGYTASALELFRDQQLRFPGFLPTYSSCLELLDKSLASLSGHDGQSDALLANQIAEERLGVAVRYVNALQESLLLDQAESVCRHILQQCPERACSWSNLANILRLQGRLSEAEAAARRALELESEHEGALVNLGCILTDLCQEPEAEDCFRRVLRRNPGNATARHNLGSGMLMNLLSRPDLSSSVLLERHRHWGSSLMSTSVTFVHSGIRNMPLRLGFLSSDFRRHSVAYFLEPLLASLNREHFVLTCYASQLEPGDEVTARLRTLALTWVPCQQLSDAELSQRIFDDDIDLLIDLNGHTRGTRIACMASRPARFQACWLGYPFATGLPAIDYRITDCWADPEVLPIGQGLPGSERPARMDRSQFVFRPDLDSPAVAPLPLIDARVVTFGSMNNLAKLNPLVIDVWSRILMRRPRSRLLLKASQLADGLWRSRVQDAFAAHGVSPDRLILKHAVPGTSAHLAVYGAIDIALDPFPYNGFTTTCEALWMGVPVVCLAGKSPQARGGVSLLHAVGRPQWIAADLQDYVELALSLAADSEGLAFERQNLRPMMRDSELCDARSHAKAFERCVHSIVEDASSVNP